MLLPNRASQKPPRLLALVLLTIVVLSPFAIPALADVIQPGVITGSGGKANPVYRRFWTETANTRGGTFGEPLYYEVDGGVVDAGVPVSDGGGFEPAAGASLRSPSAVITQDFCFTVESRGVETSGSGTAWQYATGDDPVLGQIGEPGGTNSAYLAATEDGVLYLEVCDDSGDWLSYSTTRDTLTWADATVTACRDASGTWKLYVHDEHGQPIEQPTVTDGTGDGHWSALGQDLIMGAGPGFGYRCTCGDGFVDCLEGCDDSGVAAGDGCSATCVIESGYVCTGEPSSCTLPCGDGDFDVGEECDDGNAVAADGCVSCLVEAGYQCTGSPSICVTTCGDGITAGAEGCDDGNLVDGDGCAADCTLEIVDQYYFSFNSDICDTDGIADYTSQGVDTGTYTFRATCLDSGLSGRSATTPGNNWMAISLPAFKPQQFSVAYWMKLNEQPWLWNKMIAARAGNNSDNTKAFIAQFRMNEGTGVWDTSVYHGSGVYTGINSKDYAEVPELVVDGLWHHIGMTFDGSYLRLYFDGVLVKSQVANSSTVYYAEGSGQWEFSGNYNYNNESVPASWDNLHISGGVYSAAWFANAYNNHL